MPLCETVTQLEDDQAIKTSFCPTQSQLDKLDDLASEYNRRYRRQRKKIDRRRTSYATSFRNAI